MAEKKRRVGWRKNKHVPLRSTLVLILTSTLQKTQTHDSATVMKVPQRTIDTFYQQPELAASVRLDCYSSYVSLTRIRYNKHAHSPLHMQSSSKYVAHTRTKKITKHVLLCAQQLRVLLKHT